MTTKEAVKELEAQGVLQPGESGWWKVWGANIHSAKVGDLVITKEYEFLIEDVFEAKAHPVRRGFVVDGKRITMGALVPCVVMRQETKNTLDERM